MRNQRQISVIGLGYVGLTSAIAFGTKQHVIGYDINQTRINELKNGHDHNDEISDDDLRKSDVYFTSNPDDLTKADFHIVSVPTPLDKLNHPIFSMLLDATELLACRLKKGDIVVFESTVYPGATEELCIPTLERVSQLKYGVDFTVGYSPERVNPADKVHTFQNIIKIVSGTDTKTVNIIAEVCRRVVSAGVHIASSIRVAEATKIIENIQRDVNIAYMNDIAILLHKLDIDTADVINAMKTKWNYIPFTPGLVGGHCIGVNPYYLMYKMDEVHYHSEIITASRRINENMAKFIVEEAIKELIKLGITIKHSRIAILGITYKENCVDVHDTRVIDIINELKKYEIDVLVHDPLADTDTAKRLYGIELVRLEELHNMNAMILTVAHKYYHQLDKRILKKCLHKPGLIMDIKEIFDIDDFIDSDIHLWRL